MSQIGLIMSGLRFTQTPNRGGFTVTGGNVMITCSMNGGGGRN